jgi:hypothetical protein
MGITFKVIAVMKLTHFLSIAANKILIPIISLLQITLIIRISGVEIWTVLAIGISLGGIAQALIDRGYANSGSSLMLKQNNLYFLATDSIRHRFPVFVACVLGGLIPFAVPVPFKYDLIYLSFFSLCLSGLSIDWVLISGRKSVQLFLSSVIPRLVTSIIGLTVYIFTQNISFVLWLSILGAALNVLLGVRLLYSMKMPLENRKRDFLGKQDYFLRMTNDLIWLMPIPLVNFYSPIIAPLFTFSDRLVKFPLLFTGSITHFLTSEILTSRENFRRKIHESLLIHVIVGMIFSMGTFLTLPRISRLISDDKLRVNSVDSLYIGLFAFFVIVTLPLTQQYFLLTNQKKLIMKVNCVFLSVSFLFYSSEILVFSRLLLIQTFLQAVVFFLFLFIYIRQEFVGKSLFQVK